MTAQSNMGGKIQAAWGDLERLSQTASDDRIHVLIDKSSERAMYATYGRTEARIGLRLDVPAVAMPSIDEYPRSAAFRVVPHTRRGVTQVAITLDEIRFRGVFAELCADLFLAVNTATTDKAAVLALVKRLGLWRELLTGAVRPLGEQAQLGLYGELLFLESVLDRGVSVPVAVAAWRGPLQSAQDFHFETRRVEVKTGAAHQPAPVRVASLSQLDPAGMEVLFLWYVKLQVASGGTGRTLAEQVGSLRRRLGADKADPLRRSFDDLLLQVGYFDSHALENYNAVALSRHSERVLLIKPGFPALTAAGVPRAVTAASYHLDLSLLDNTFDVDLDTAYAMVLLGHGSEPGSA